MNALHAPKGGIDMIEGHYRGGQFIPFYVPRRLMPQIDSEFYPNLIVDAIGRGVTLEVIEPGSITPHQRINHRAAEAMPLWLRMKPLIVSADHYVLDGNHRWWAAHKAGDSYINVIRLHMGFDSAIDWLLLRPYTYTLDPAHPQPERN